MRQYRIVTKTPETEQTLLEPGVHAGLYNIPEIRSAVEVLQANVHFEMIGIRIGARFYSLIATDEDSLKPGHFELVPSNA